MSIKQTEDQSTGYSFILSLILHTLFLIFSGKLVYSRPAELRVEVDLKTLPSQVANQPINQAIPQPVRNIPRPYQRTKANLKSQAEKMAPKSLATVIPISPKPLAVAQAFANQTVASCQKVDWQQHRAKEGAVEKIYLPLTETDGASVSTKGVTGQIKGFSPGWFPGHIQASSEPFGQPEAYLADEHIVYDSYRWIIRQHIEEHKRYPLLATRRGLEGRVGLRFLLYRDAHVEKIEVTKSSQVSLLDEAAMRAVKEGNPFPTFPESIYRDSMLIEITLSFELRGRI